MRQQSPTIDGQPPERDRAAEPPRDTRAAPIPGPATIAFLLSGLLLLLAQVFVPFDVFVHRGDDAYYYFKLAANYPHLGFWSFDGVEPTNGVQPLWAIVLTTVAQLAAWLGIDDPRVLDRLFVSIAAVMQFAAAIVLFRVISARVSSGTGLAAAGACMLPLAFVWGRLWGMESPLLALTLTSTVAYHHLSFRVRPSTGRAALLGVLLGLACLSRLNAGLLIPCLLGFHLLDRSAGPLADRMRGVIVAGAVASLPIAAYLAMNLATTGHVLPISGQVKSIGVAAALDAWEGAGGSVRRFASFVYWNWKGHVEWFVSSRLLDGMWITGVRLLHDEAATWRQTFGVVAAVALAPVLAGRPREWLGFLAERLRRLAPFAYFLAYAVVESVVAISLYPTQTYAIPRWWLVSGELVLIVLGATLSVAALSYLGQRMPAAIRRPALAAGALGVLVAAHAWQVTAFYWGGRMEVRDWNQSWNDESYRAARWLDHNVPPGELVGSWNAGVLGYYSRHRVVNLDGLINNARLLPYLRERRLDEYILERKLRYLSDMDGMFARELGGRLALTEVYRHHSRLMGSDYRIYRVDGPARLAVTELRR